MGASAKKKKDKKKDFQKAKLKVGKTKPKASNFTDTSFKSKSEFLLLHWRRLYSDPVQALPSPINPSRPPPLPLQLFLPIICLF
jgi:hypothetical protein